MCKSLTGTYLAFKNLVTSWLPYQIKPNLSMSIFCYTKPFTILPYEGFTVLVIQPICVLTRAYTPGRFSSAHPNPQETKPTSLYLPAASLMTSGPPLSPCN